MRIYLSTEGTYPFAPGGVSTWVDMLLHGLPDHEFEVAALVDNPHHRIAYRPPPNVNLRPIPLWGLELAEEYLPRPDGWRRAWRTSSSVVRNRFLPSWEQLVESLCAPEADPEALGDGLSAVAHFAERYDLRRALADAATWALLLDRLTTNPIHSRTGLAPAMEFSRTLYRYLLPLTAPTPVCDVAHSSAAALLRAPGHRHQVPVRDAGGAHGARHLPAGAVAGAVQGTVRDEAPVRQLLPGRRRAGVPRGRRRHAGLRVQRGVGGVARRRPGAHPGDPQRCRSRPDRRQPGAGGSTDRRVRRPHRSDQGRGDPHPGLRPRPAHHARCLPAAVGTRRLPRLPGVVPHGDRRARAGGRGHVRGPHQRRVRRLPRRT